MVINAHSSKSAGIQTVVDTLVIFLMIWILVGIYIIYSAQGQIKKWAQQEH